MRYLDTEEMHWRDERGRGKEDLMNRHVKEALTEFSVSMAGFALMAGVLWYFRAWTVPAFLWVLEKAEAVVSVF